MSNEVVFDGMTHWSVEFNGVKYPVTHYGINACHFYEDIDGEECQYTAPMVHFEGELDLPLDMTLEQARGIAWNAACSCGYAAPSTNWEDMSITIYGNYRAYRVWYGKEGGMVNAKVVTLEVNIEALVNEINRMIRELNSAIGGGLDKVHGLSLNEFEAWIYQKKFELEDMKEQLDVQTGNG